MARDLGVLGATISHPDRIERERGAESQIVLQIISNDLKSRPLHMVELSEEDALSLLVDLSKCLAIKRGVRVR